MKRVLLCVGLLALIVAGAASAADVIDVRAKNGMVSSAHELASKAGVEILQKGGNAVDAAVATQLALNVVEPNASGIGGGGFMTIRNAKTGEVVVLDYREIAPLSATKDMFASEESKKAKESELGGKAIGVPGAVKGMFTALRKYGTMSFAQVAEPALRLAEQGFEVHPMQQQIITDEFEKLSKYSPTCVFIVDGLPAQKGTILKQPQLAKTLRLLAKDGPDAFYKGPIADAVVVAVNKAGGAMTKKDLANYALVEREPVKGTYRGYSIYSVPPASSGGTHIVELLNIMETFPVAKWKHNSAQHLHTLAEAMKLMYADRGAFMADTAFVKVPLKGLADKGYAAKRAGLIKQIQVMKDVAAGDPAAFEKGAQKTADLRGGGEKHISTSHFSVVDAQGNIVASTNTVNYFFGSGVIVPEYGFVLNNEMDDFAFSPKSVNAPEPGKRPLSSMSPTIVTDREGRPFITFGSAGATRIISALAQILMNVVDFGMTMDQAIEQPRIFNFVSGGKAGKLLIETGVDPKVVDLLKLRGHDLEVRPFSGYFGTSQGIMFDWKTATMDGGADSRRLGVPVGY
jgi:gamma-glutamyltranspeptidase/glutathione hydrolase